MCDPTFVANTTNTTAINKFAITKYRFFVPLLSGFMGQLIPASEYKLIPLRALFGTELEVRLNPYAFFTTNLKDSETTMAPRAWTIKNI